ncbi:MAG: peroxide stress protein YaaA [Acidimicrobiia bacterium]|nr:peroxide stress protein YaaA [Acidimicrobiia bacterium]
MLYLLLPPSEGKVEGGDGRGWQPDQGAFSEFAPLRIRVVNALRRARGGTAKHLGATGDLLARAKAANRTLVGAPTLPAWQRFSGVVWEALDPATVRAAARRRAESGVIVVSAVTGLSAWDDPIPDFRLKLSASIPPIGRLAAFWQEPLSRVLNERLAGHTVVDLLPNEHRAAWTPDPDRYELIRPVLATRDGAPAGHAGKATKGRLARALLDSGRPDRTFATFDAGDLALTVASHCGRDHPVR